MTIDLKQCSVCGGSKLISNKILWAELISDWELSPEEVEYIDVQQGYACQECGANLRSMTLAGAIMNIFQFSGTLTKFSEGPCRDSVSGVLEINGAGSLTPFLERFQGYKFVTYPEVDMQNMRGISDGSFQLVIQSDTLEHVLTPVKALEECRRVLKPGGHLLYTIPIIVGRMTRRRDALPPSYHGDSSNPRPDHLVVTEYGADAWCQLFQAGFKEISMFSLSFPHSIVLIGRKDLKE